MLDRVREAASRIAPGGSVTDRSRRQAFGLLPLASCLPTPKVRGYKTISSIPNHKVLRPRARYLVLADADADADAADADAVALRCYTDTLTCNAAQEIDSDKYFLVRLNKKNVSSVSGSRKTMIYFILPKISAKKIFLEGSSRSAGIFKIFQRLRLSRDREIRQGKNNYKSASTVF